MGADEAPDLPVDLPGGHAGGHHGPRKGPSVDVGAFKDGFHGDCAGTYPCGRISEEAERLIEVTRQSFFEGLKYAREGRRLPELCGAIQRYAEGAGCSVRASSFRCRGPHTPVPQSSPPPPHSAGWRRRAPDPEARAE